MCVCEWIGERSSRNHMKFLNHYTYNRIVHCQTLSANRVGFRLCLYHNFLGDSLQPLCLCLSKTPGGEYRRPLNVQHNSACGWVDDLMIASVGLPHLRF